MKQVINFVQYHFVSVFFAFKDMKDRDGGNNELHFKSSNNVAKFILCYATNGKLTLKSISLEYRMCSKRVF